MARTAIERGEARRWIEERVFLNASSVPLTFNYSFKFARRNWRGLGGGGGAGVGAGRVEGWKPEQEEGRKKTRRAAASWHRIRSAPFVSFYLVYVSAAGALATVKRRHNDGILVYHEQTRRSRKQKCLFTVGQPPETVFPLWCTTPCLPPPPTHPPRLLGVFERFSTITRLQSYSS